MALPRSVVAGLVAEARARARRRNRTVGGWRRDRIATLGCPWAFCTRILCWRAIRARLRCRDVRRDRPPGVGGPDLNGLVATVARTIGVQPPQPGGRHEGHGTRNYLVGLAGGRYLELLGPDLDQPDPAGPRQFGVDELTGPALVGWRCGRQRRRRCWRRPGTAYTTPARRAPCRGADLTAPC
ncbi:MAG: hypothetical protein GEV04_19795 [Actinophytocola sp.]|nr:hypothetical protein [Actinophytocola sp.]